MSTICWNCINSGKCYQKDRTSPCDRYENTFEAMERDVIFKDGDCAEFGCCTSTSCKYWYECDGI